MYQLKLMSGEKFEISKEDVNLLSGKSGLVFLPTLNGFVNISSISIIAPIELANQDRKKTRDGRWCIRKFGQWYLENNPDIRVDLSHYPELEGGEKKELGEPSSFAMELSDKI